MDAIQQDALCIVMVHAVLVPTLTLAVVTFACGWFIGWVGDLRG